MSGRETGTGTGTCTVWHDDHGWGAVRLDGSGLDGSGLEAWTHFSAIEVDGYRNLEVGQRVECDWEVPGQDGYPARTTRVALLPAG